MLNRELDGCLLGVAGDRVRGAIRPSSQRRAFPPGSAKGPTRSPVRISVGSARAICSRRRRCRHGMAHGMWTTDGAAFHTVEPCPDRSPLAVAGTEASTVRSTNRQSYSTHVPNLNPIPMQAGSRHLCWCCGRRLVDHPSLCRCGQPHYCEGRPANWGQATGPLAW